MSLRTQTLGPLTVCIFLFLPVAELSLSYQLPTGSGPATLQAHVAAPLCTVGGVTKRKQGLDVPSHAYAPGLCPPGGPVLHTAHQGFAITLSVSTDRFLQNILKQACFESI